MSKKTPKSEERLAFDKQAAALLPYLPLRYVTAVHVINSSIEPERLHAVVRGRGSEPDWEAYHALSAIKRKEPVPRKERKKHAPRRPKLQSLEPVTD